MNLQGVVAGYLGMRAPIRGYMLHLSDAIEDGQRSVDLALEHRRHRSAMVSYQAMGYFLLESGEISRGVQELQKGLDLARELGAGRFVPISQLFLAKVALLEDRVEEARATAAEAKRISDETAPKFTGPWALGTLLLLPETDETRYQICAEAAQTLDAGCISHNYLWFHRDAMDAWLRAGNPAAALEHAAKLEAYCAHEPFPWSDLYIRRGRALAGLLEDGDPGAARAEVQAIIAEAETAGLLRAVPMMRAALEGRPLSL